MIEKCIHHFNGKVDHELYAQRTSNAHGERLLKHTMNLIRYAGVKYQIDLHECHSNGCRWCCCCLKNWKENVPIFLTRFCNTLSTLGQKSNGFIYAFQRAAFAALSLSLSLLLSSLCERLLRRIWLWMYTKDLIVWHNCELQHGFVQLGNIELMLFMVLVFFSSLSPRCACLLACECVWCCNLLRLWTLWTYVRIANRVHRQT